MTYPTRGIRRRLLSETLSSPTFIISTGICRAAHHRHTLSPSFPLSFYCPQSFQKSFVPLETSSPACSANFTGNIIGQERSVVPSTRLFNILRTVFSLQCRAFSLAPSLSLSLSLFFCLLFSYSLVLSSHCPHSYPFNYFPSTFRNLRAFTFSACDFIASLNNRCFLFLAP